MHKTFSLGTVSNMIEMGIVVPESISDTGDDIELCFYFPFSMFCGFLKELFIFRRFQGPKLRVNFIPPCAYWAQSLI